MVAGSGSWPCKVEHVCVLVLHEEAMRQGCARRTHPVDEAGDWSVPHLGSTEQCLTGGQNGMGGLEMENGF